MIDGLEDACAVCSRPAGDHTLREWSACLGQPATVVPYDDTPDDLAGAYAHALREQFQLDPGVVVADHVVIRAATLSATSGPVAIKLPALMHDFQIGVAGRPPIEVAKVAFVGNVKSVRAYGRLARDSANGAANAAEKL